MDRIDQWRIFTAVATQRSFGKAARVVGKSPQQVTRAVAALEQRIGTRLFNRTTRSVSLTGDGERLLEKTRRAIAEFDALESPARADAPLTGTLSLTAPVLFGQLHVLPVVTGFLARHPALDVRLLLLDRMVSLSDEGVDAAVRIGNLRDSSLRARVVGHVRSVVVASPAYLARHGMPRSPDALAHHACIAFSGTTPVVDRWSFRRHGERERSVAVRPRLVVNAGQAAIDAALAGLGIVRVLSYQVDALVEQGRLKPLLPSWEPPPMPVQIVQLPGVQARSAVAWVEFASSRLRTRLQR